MTTSDRRSVGFTVAALAVCGALAAGLFLVTDSASAAVSYTNACPDPPGAPGGGDLTDDAIETRNQRIADAAICEAILERLEGTNQRLDDILDSEDTSAAQRVALAPKDRDRLDLIWWGAWAAVGLMLCQLIAAKWYSSWRILRD